MLTISGSKQPAYCDRISRRHFLKVGALGGLTLADLHHLKAQDDQPANVAFPTFRMQEIDKGLPVCYAVLLVDINGDGKKDIVVVNPNRVVWYENPTWKRRTIIEGKTKPDNVCIDAYDIDGDGQLDLALGSGWSGPGNLAEAPMYWLKRGKTLDEAWTAYPIGAEPSVHRIRFADVLGEGKPQLVSGPLMGRGSNPVRTIAYKIPKEPTKDRWEPVVLDESLHVCHNIWPVPSADGKRMDVLAASREGINLLTLDSGKWVRKQLSDPKGPGSSEIKLGKLKDGKKYVGTIEPWHGNQVVVYTPPDNAEQPFWDRQVLDKELSWGHAVWCADLDGKGNDTLIVGVRDNKGKEPGQRCGVRIYKALDAKGTKWARQVVEDGGVAVEDLAAADLANDGRIDIVAVGRQTGNIRIYWNEGVKD